MDRLQARILREKLFYCFKQSPSTYGCRFDIKKRDLKIQHHLIVLPAYVEGASTYVADLWLPEHSSPSLSAVLLIAVVAL